MNKFKSRLICLVLVTVMVFTATAQIAFADTEHTIDGKKLDFLKALDLVWGYDVIINNEALIQKADFAIFLARALNLDTEGYSGSVVFQDIPENHRAYGAVGRLAELGVFPMGKTFGSEEFVDKDIAIGIFAQIAGYRSPTGVASVNSAAFEKSLLNGVEFYRDPRLTSFQLITMLYNFLHTPVVQQIGYGYKETYEVSKDETILTTYFDIYKTKGIVSSTSSGTLVGESSTSEGIVRVDNTEYHTGAYDFGPLVGCEVKLYYRKTDEDLKGTVVYLEDTGSEAITLLSSDALYANGVYKYYDSQGKEKTAEIPLNAAIIYNGKQSDLAPELMNPTVGEIKLYDTDFDGKYETVHITDYETYVVEKMNTSELVATLRYNKGVLDFKADSIKVLNVYDTEGKQTPLNKIRSWNVLMLAKSHDGEIVNIIVSKDMVKGTVSSINTTSDIITVAIDDIEYEVSPHYPSDKTEAIKLGDSGTFRLDNYGRIAAFTKTSQTGYYAYVVDRIVENKGLNRRALVKLFTEANGGEMLISGLANNVTIDGVNCNNMGIRGETDYFNTNVVTGEVVVYTLNQKGEIKSIDTKAPNEDNSAGILVAFDSSNKARQFRDNTFEGHANISENTVIFAIPEDGDDEKYACVGPDFFADNAYYTFISYSYSQHDIIVDAMTTTAKSASETISSKSLIFVMGNKSKMLNEKGIAAVYADFYGTSKITYEIHEDCPNIDLVEPGDLVYIAYNSHKVVTDIRLIYDRSANKYVDTDQDATHESTGVNISLASGWAVEWRTAVLNVYQYGSGFVRMTFKPYEDLSRDSIPDDLRSYAIGTAKVWLVESNSRGNCTVTSATADSIYDFIHYGSEMSKIAIQLNYGRATRVVIYR